MSSSSDNSSKNETSTNVQGELTGFQSDLGIVLKKAREAQKLSIQDVCGRLHFNEKILHAIEEDNFSVFNDPAQARAFIRGYARLLCLDEEALLNKHRQLFPDLVLNAIGVKTETMTRTSKRVQFPKYSILVAALLAIGSLVWYISTLNFSSHPTEQSAEASLSDESRPEVALPAAERANETDARQLATEIQLPAVPNVANVETSSPDVSKGESVKPVLVNGVDFQLIATEDSWVTVKDAAGKTIFTKLVKSGTSELVHGTPPLNLHIGNAKGVQLLINGKSVDFSSSVYNNTARVTLDAE